MLAETGTLAGANEERAHGNNHLITCLTRSGGRRCARDWFASAKARNAPHTMCILEEGTAERILASSRRLQTSPAGEGDWCGK